MSRICTPEDNGSHSPPADDINWQESFFLSWYDACSGSGGYHHVDFQPFRKRACVWSWIAAGRRVISRFQSLNLPFPEGDLGDFEAGPIAVRTLKPLSDYAMRVRHERKDGPGFAEENIVFKAFTQPLYLSMDEAGRPTEGGGKVGVSDYHSGGTGHYENIGKVEGVIVDFDGRRIDVCGFGMQDHSWGPRQYGALTAAHRFVHGAFGPDLFFSLYAMAKEDADFSYGYVHDNGSFHRVRDLQIDVVMDRDGHTPKRVEIDMWSPTGRGYSFSGEGHVGSVSTHDGGYFGTDVYGEFRFGARRGTGLIGVRERAGPSARHRAWLSAFDPGPSTANR